MSLTIKDVVKEAYETAKSKGWYDKPASFGDRIALVHSELSEALEAYRVLDNDSYDSIREPLYESTVPGATGTTRVSASFVTINENGEAVMRPNKPTGVASELADVVIRIADMCGLYGIDLERSLSEKMAYNKTRSYRHGGKRL